MGAACPSSGQPGGLWASCCLSPDDCKGVLCDELSTEVICGNDGEFGDPGRRRQSAGDLAVPSGTHGWRRKVAAHDKRRSPEELSRRIEELSNQLFNTTDINHNGLLEEEELISLNEKIAKLHHGPNHDTSEVRSTYRTLFRDKFDPEGRPVPYSIFRRYTLEVLYGLDDDPEAQEMIMEQFVAEAQSAIDVMAEVEASGGAAASPCTTCQEAENSAAGGGGAAAALAAGAVAKPSAAVAGGSGESTDASPSGCEGSLPEQPGCMPRVPRCASDSSTVDMDFAVPGAVSCVGSDGLLVIATDEETRCLRRAHTDNSDKGVLPLMSCQAPARTPSPNNSGVAAKDAVRTAAA